MAYNDASVNTGAQLGSTDHTFTFVSCAFFMLLVGWISYRKTRGEVATKDVYFLAGMALLEPSSRGCCC